MLNLETIARQSLKPRVLGNGKAQPKAMMLPWYSPAQCPTQAARRALMSGPTIWAGRALDIFFNVTFDLTLGVPVGSTCRAYKSARERKTEILT